MKFFYTIGYPLPITTLHSTTIFVGYTNFDTYGEQVKKKCLIINETPVCLTNFRT